MRQTGVVEGTREYVCGMASKYLGTFTAMRVPNPGGFVTRCGQKHIARRAEANLENEMFQSPHNAYISSISNETSFSAY